MIAISNRARAPLFAVAVLLTATVVTFATLPCTAVAPHAPRYLVFRDLGGHAETLCQPPMTDLVRGLEVLAMGTAYRWWFDWDRDFVAAPASIDPRILLGSRCAPHDAGWFEGLLRPSPGVPSPVEPVPLFL
jgi:hypothetical protein